MNEPIHCCTGYLAGRVLGHREHRFEPLYVAVAAYSPDFDFLLRKVSPFFEHGVWTHTLVGMAAIAAALSAVTWAVLALVYRGSPIPFWRLCALALLGGATHLFLDAFTYYESAAADATHHMYFWPLWNFPWHINTVFPEASYSLRVAVEVVYSVAVAGVILFQWAVRGQNPLRALDPRGWFRAETAPKGGLAG